MRRVILAVTGISIDVPGGKDRTLSFQQIEQQSPYAADLLRLCAFLAPDAIPEELLIRGISVFGDAHEAEHDG